MISSQLLIPLIGEKLLPTLPSFTWTYWDSHLILMNSAFHWWHRHFDFVLVLVDFLILNTAWKSPSLKFTSWSFKQIIILFWSYLSIKYIYSYDLMRSSPTAWKLIDSFAFTPCNKLSIPSWSAHWIWIIFWCWSLLGISYAVPSSISILASMSNIVQNS